MKEYKFTIIGFFLSVVLWFIILAFDLELFDKLAQVFIKLEPYKIDELIFPLMILIIFVHVDLLKKQRQIKIEAEKTKIYKAMLVANQHILNNFLNGMQIFKLTAEETYGFPKEVIKLYEEINKHAKTQIEELSSIDKIDEKLINKAIQPS